MILKLIGWGVLGIAGIYYLWIIYQLMMHLIALNFLANDDEQKRNR